MAAKSKEQILQILKGNKTQADIEANKAAAAQRRESDLMILGYNQALLDTGNLPEGFTMAGMVKIIESQKAKLGISLGE